MDINKYAEWTGNTCASLKDKETDNIHMLMGMSTEIGELMDVFKKNIAYNKTIDWINVKEEIGDTLYYIASFCRINELDLEEILNMNISKLESRYPEKFTEYHANNRNLKREREILETEPE